LRHPIYTAILLLAIGLFLRKPTATIAATGAAVVVFLMIKVRFEEQLLLARYPEYAGYRNRTWHVGVDPRRPTLRRSFAVIRKRPGAMPGPEPVRETPGPRSSPVRRTAPRAARRSC